MASDSVKDYWNDRVKPRMELIKNWARHGLTDKEIANNLGIAEVTLVSFKGKYKDLYFAIEDSRMFANALVENALFKKCLGYEYKETTKERLKERDEDGKWTGDYIMTTTKQVTKQVQPDFASIQYWLERRAGEDWKRTPDPTVNLDSINQSILTLAQLIGNPLPERAIGSEHE